jgi:VanZ family protein
MEADVNQERAVNGLFLFLSLFLWIMVLAWMWLIFYLSAETGQDSLSRSDAVIAFIHERFGFDVSSFVIRKVAHALEFGVLTVLTYLSFASSARISEKKSFIEMSSTDMKSGFEMNASFSLWATVLYAVFDEYHQIFVFERNGSIIDVLIGIAGGLAVIVFIRIIHAISFIVKKIKLSQEN